MTPQDIEAELSYAYLHAVAAHAGVACQASTRSHDNLGIDATLSLRKDFGEGATLTDVTLHIQLKATVKHASPVNDRFGFWLDSVDEYDRLRQQARPPRLLAVLFLPEAHQQWLRHSAEQLALCRCAYWLSLFGAPATSNGTGQTVYFPQHQALSPDCLMDLFARVARLEDLRYVP